MPQLRCEWCGQLATPKWRGQKTCSRSCAGKLSNFKRWRGMPRFTIICATCGKEFGVRPHRQNAKYCSKSCAARRPDNIQRCSEMVKLRVYPEPKRRYDTNWTKISHIALEAGGYRCAKCGADLKAIRASVHHIIPYWLEPNGEHFLPLCQSCHTELEHILHPIIEKATTDFLQSCPPSFNVIK